MPSRPNVFADRFSAARGDLRSEPVADRAGAEQLGGTLYELAPGADGVPLHVHHGMEELAVVLAGTPTLRTLEGEFELEAGDVVAFPRGRRGAHTLVNRSDAPDPDEDPADRLMLLFDRSVGPTAELTPEVGNRLATCGRRRPASMPDVGDLRERLSAGSRPALCSGAHVGLAAPARAPVSRR